MEKHPEKTKGGKENLEKPLRRRQRGTILLREQERMMNLYRKMERHRW